MSTFKQFVTKTWVCGAAGAMILGSGAVMSTALSQSAFADTTNGSSVSSDGGYTLSTTPNQPTVTPKNGQLGAALKAKELRPPQTPGPQDLSAQQGAADAAALLKQAYSVDLTGYKATAVFIKGVAPNTDQWDVEFSSPHNATSVPSYAASVNAVTGQMTAVSDTTVSAQSTSSTTINVSDPVWTSSAEKDIPRLLPAGVSISSSRVVAQKDGIVYVVSELSNGATMGVMIQSQDHNFPEGYQYWHNGYDGGWAGYNLR